MYYVLRNSGYFHVYRVAWLLQFILKRVVITSRLGHMPLKSRAKEPEHGHHNHHRYSKTPKLSPIFLPLCIASHLALLRTTLRNTSPDDFTISLPCLIHGSSCGPYSPIGFWIKYLFTHENVSLIPEVGMCLKSISSTRL